MLTLKICLNEDFKKRHERRGERDEAIIIIIMIAIVQKIRLGKRVLDLLLKMLS